MPVAMTIISVALAFNVTQSLFFDVCATGSQLSRSIEYNIIIDTYTSDQQLPGPDIDVPWYDVANVNTSTKSYYITLTTLSFGEYCIHYATVDSTCTPTEWLEEELKKSNQLDFDVQKADGRWYYERINARYNFNREANWKLCNRVVRKALLSEGVMDEELRNRFANEAEVAEIMLAIYQSNESCKEVALTQLLMNLLTTRVTAGASAQSIKANHVKMLAEVRNATENLTKPQLIDLLGKISLVEQLENGSLLVDALRLLKMQSPEKLYGATQSYADFAQEVQVWIDRATKEGGLSSGARPIVEALTLDKAIDKLKSVMKTNSSDADSSSCDGNSSSSSSDESDSAPTTTTRSQKRTEGKNNNGPNSAFTEQQLLKLAKGPLKYDRRKKFCEKKKIQEDQWNVPTPFEDETRKLELLSANICLYCGADFYGVEHRAICPKQSGGKPASASELVSDYYIEDGFRYASWGSI